MSEINFHAEDTLTERAGYDYYCQPPKVVRGLIIARMAAILSAYSVVQLLYISILILYVLNLS